MNRDPLKSKIADVKHSGRGRRGRVGKEEGGIKEGSGEGREEKGGRGEEGGGGGRRRESMASLQICFKI